MAEATKDQLQQQLTDALRQLTDTQHERDTAQRDLQGLRDALTAAATEKNELQGQLSDERARSGELAGELNEAENLIEELQQRLKTAQSLQAQSDTLIVSDGTSHYKVLAPKFKFRHVEYTGEQLRSDEQLVRELIEAGVGFLQKIEIGE
jgi:DNA repair exonuclease SbcCD ATPase subunit